MPIGLHTVVILLLMGACLHSAATHALRLAGAMRKAMHLQLAALGIAAVIFLSGWLRATHAESVPDMVSGVRWVFAGMLLASALVLLFVHQFAGKPLHWSARVLLASFAGLLVANALMPLGLAYIEAPSIVRHVLADGATISLPEARSSPGYLAATALILLCMAYCARLARGGGMSDADPARRLVLGSTAAFALLMLALLIARLLDIPFVGLALIPAFGLIALVLSHAFWGRRHEEVEAERILVQEREEMTAALVRLSLRGGQPDEPEADAMQDMLDEVCKVLDVDRASIWRLSADGNLRALLVHEREGGPQDAGQTFGSDQYPHYFTLLRQSNCIASDDVQNDPRLSEFWLDYYQPKGIHATLDTAIRQEGQLIGLICAEARRPGKHWHPAHVAFMTNTAAILATRWSSREQAAVNQSLCALAAIGSGDARQQFFLNAARCLAQLYTADIAFVGLLAESGCSVDAIAVWADGRPGQTFSYDLAGTPCAEVVGRTACTFPMHVQAAFPSDHLLVEMGIEGYAGSPFFAPDGSPLGLVVALTRQEMRYSAHTNEAMRILSSRVGAEVERQRAERRLHHLAYFDYLTGLPTRTHLGETLNSEIERVRKQGGHAALLLIDLDHFKVVNDALSHDVGDEVLRQIGRTLESFANNSELAARLGGDEFALLLRQTDSASRDEAAILARAQALLETLQAPVQVGERIISVGLSVGAVLIDATAGSSWDILRKAEIALYRAKAGGRGQCQLFRATLEQETEKRLQLQEGLRHAIELGELSLCLQPKVDADGRPHGAEVLLRWHSTALGAVSPADFIPVAEETGLIIPIGRWVLEQACRILRNLQDRTDTAAANLAVNISAWQLGRPDFVDEVMEVVSRQDIDPRRLTLEVTESLVLQDLADAIGKLEWLRAKGFRIALDDFGTGYSSLSYLRQLPLDELKIDRAFVTEISSEIRNPLVHSMVAIGQHMGLDVVAEGVETDTQLQRLVAIGCERFQGFLFSPPLEEAAYLAWLEQPAARRISGVKTSSASDA